jgi:hypothetical protein
VEAFGDGEQPARLRCRVAVLGDVGSVDDARQQPEGRIVEPVLLDEDLERAQPVSVRVPRAGRVVGVGLLALGGLEHLVRRDVQELGLRIDEVPDQPWTGDPIGLRSLACHPFHLSSPSSNLAQDGFRPSRSACRLYS